MINLLNSFSSFVDPISVGKILWTVMSNEEGEDYQGDAKER